jgi:hypothetical protein
MMESSNKAQVEYEKQLLGRQQEPSLDEEIDMEASGKQFLKDIEEFAALAKEQGKSILDRAPKQAFQDLQDELNEYLNILRTGAELSAEQKSEMADVIEAIKDSIEVDDYIYDNNFAKTKWQGDKADKKGSKPESEKQLSFFEKHSPDSKRLLVLQLHVKNYISDGPDSHVYEVPRVSSISSLNVNFWTMKYELSEIDDETTKMKLYGQMKSRRMAFEGRDENFYGSPYMTELMQISRNGRDYRRTQEEKRKNSELVVFQPYAES